MKIVFTICSNNYLAQAKVLGQSLKAFAPDYSFMIALVDERDDNIDYAALPFEVVPIGEIEPAIDVLAEKYNIIELNTCVKPGIIQYLFREREADTIVYLDPDTRLYSRLTELEERLTDCAIVLTPHILTPIPIDGKTPGEHKFLNYGIYNLGFIGLRNCEETRRFVGWWKDWTYQLGYSWVQNGIFVDQLPINHVPLFFKDVHILRHKGYNMAPWNLHERALATRDNGDIWVNDEEKLKFFHFSSFKVDSGELPLHYYNRFRLQDRPDLKDFYADYNAELKAAGYAFFSSLPCRFVTLNKTLAREKKQRAWKNKPLAKRLAIRMLFTIPASVRVFFSRLNRDPNEYF